MQAEPEEWQDLVLDRKAMRELAALWDPHVPVFGNVPYRERAIEINRRAEAAMQGDRSALHGRSDRAWIPPIPTAEEEQGTGT